MSKFAVNTSVSVDKSQAEIKALLIRYGASQYVTGDDTEQGRSFVEFRAENRSIRFLLTLPQRSEKRFWFTPGRHTKRSDADAYREWEQACRTK